MTAGSTYKLLVVDDEDTVLRSYASVFQSVVERATTDKFAELESELFGSADIVPELDFTITTCKQGDDAVFLVEQSVRMASDCRFSVVFIDMRMPPGIHGLEAANRIHEADPNAKIVIVTGYSDFTLGQLAMAFPPSADVYYMQKPFDGNDIWGLAAALSKLKDGNWVLDAAEQALVDRYGLCGGIAA